MRGVTLWIGVAMLSMLPSTALPCVCATNSFLDEFKKAAAVFVGEVTSFRTIDESRSVAQVKVLRFWKGRESPEQLEILTDRPGNSNCSGVLAKGTYLIYACKEGQWLATWPCMRTRLLKDAGEDLKALGAGRVPRGPR